MSSEAVRIADQLRRAFSGEAWHGPSLRETLAGITAAQALARPLPSAHSIWELVLHIDAWVNSPFEATQGVPMPDLELLSSEKDWPQQKQSDAAWTAATDQLFNNAERLARAIDGFTDARLKETVPGRRDDFYFLFQGVVQHSLYHAGQIAMLKRAVSAA